MLLDIKKLKDLMGRISLAVEKSKLNPKAGWIELEATNTELLFKVANYNYYLEANIKFDTNIADDDKFHVTILAETFIPLISKLDVDTIKLYEYLGCLMLETDSGKYTFPLIKEAGKTRCVDAIPFNPSISTTLSGSDLSTVSSINAKGLDGASFVSQFESYVYIDNLGALISTHDSMYVNNFDKPSSTEFKALLTLAQARLLDIFKDYDEVLTEVELIPSFEDGNVTNIIRLGFTIGDLKLVLNTQSEFDTDRWPSLILRSISESENQAHVVIDKKLLDKALARLMVFDKKFGSDVFDYSQLEFTDDCLKLVSTKNKNYEIIPYVSKHNFKEYISLIRFADLIKQLKSITTKEIDISYSNNNAIIINSSVKQIIPEIVKSIKV